MTKTYRIGNTEFIKETSIKQITIQGQELKTTPGSYNIMSELLENPNKLYTKQRIDREILKLKFTNDDPVYRGSHTLYTLISQLKRELKCTAEALSKKGFNADLSCILICRKGQGYYLKA